MSADYETQLARALQALADNDTQTAFRALHPILDFPGLLDSETRWTEALETFAQIAETVAGEEFSETVRHAAYEANDVQAMFDLGYALIEHELHGPAATVLSRANAMFPGVEAVVSELVFALGEIGRHREAMQRLREVPYLVDSHFTIRFSAAFQNLMLGEIEQARELLPMLRLLVGRPEEGVMAEDIDAMIRRADAIKPISPLDADDLRGWHFAITGGILLHRSPVSPDSMHGRYTYLQDSFELLHEGILRLQTVLRAIDAMPQRIVVLPERDCAIVAHAAAQILDLPLVGWNEVFGPGAEMATDTAREIGLCVAYDLMFLPPPVLKTLHVHRPGQIVWAHASQWTTEPPFTADATTLLHQFCIPPWGEQVQINVTTKHAITVPPSDAAVEDLAARIASAKPEAMADIENLEIFAKTAAAFAAGCESHDVAIPGLWRTHGRRSRQWSQSPVPSNRFV